MPTNKFWNDRNLNPPMSNVILPYIFYLTGSLLWFAGTLISLWQVTHPK